MKKSVLNYRFHNPNTTEETANFIIKIFIEAGTPLLEKVIAKKCDSINVAIKITESQKLLNLQD